MLNLSSIIRKPGRDPVDDFRIVRSWKEYTDDRKYMKYLMYELEMLEKNGNIVHFYKAVKFTRIIRLPKSAKQSESFMDMHGQVLAAIWERNETGENQDFKRGSVMSKRTEKHVEYKSDYHKRFIEVFKNLTQRYGRFQIWSDFVVMTACAISNAFDTRFAVQREEAYKECASRYGANKIEQIAEMFSMTIPVLLGIEKYHQKNFRWYKKG